MSLPGAHCVLSFANGGQVAGEVVCMVHTHVAPCPRDGEAANPGAIHTDGIPSRDAAVAAWRLRTHGQRTLVVHVGDLTDETHSIDVNDVNCWCGPEVIWAVQFEPQEGAA